jgi:hypothetical protein
VTTTTAKVTTTHNAGAKAQSAGLLVAAMTLVAVLAF